jgi:ribosomal protein S27AE
MKLCGSCKTEKHESLFGKRAASKDGLSYKCKICQKAYDAARSNDEYRKVQREIYAQTEEGKLASNKAKAEYRKRNPVKAKAHAIVARNIRSGKLFQCPCEVCGSSIVVAHHDDYLKPLNVRWLCQAHHKQWHAKNGEGKNAF